MAYQFTTEFGRKAQLLTAVGQYPHMYPGWENVKESSHSRPSKTGGLRALAKKLGEIGKRQATVASLSEQLGALDPEVAKAAKYVISNTVGFAKNVLEAEQAANFRAAILGFDTSDMMPTGPHYAVKQRASGQLAMSSTVKAAASSLIAARQALPYQEKELLMLQPKEHPLFLGYAELFGVARAGFNPGSLNNYFYTPDLYGVPERTVAFWNNADAIVEGMRSQTGVTDQLRAIDVWVPEAMQVADNPTLETVLSVASAITQRVAAGEETGLYR